MKSFVAALVILAIGSVLVRHWTDQRLKGYEAQAKARESLLQDSLARTILRVDANSVEVVKRVTVTKTLRDSVLVNKTDTLLVERLVYATDTLELACLRCTASAAQLKVWSNSSIQFWKGRYESVKPSWKDRFGVCVGYGGTFGPDRTVLHGANVGVCARVWP